MHSIDDRIRPTQPTPEVVKLVDRIMVGKSLEGSESKSADDDAEWENNDGFITQTVVARRLRVSVRSVDNLRVEGLPAYLLGRSVRFRWEEVKAFLAANHRTCRHSDNETAKSKRIQL
jgi:hypothetical protein